MVWLFVGFCLYLIVGAAIIEISKDRARIHGYYECNLFEISLRKGLGAAFLCWVAWPIYVQVMLEHVPAAVAFRQIGKCLGKLRSRSDKVIRRVSGRRE